MSHFNKKWEKLKSDRDRIVKDRQFDWALGATNRAAKRAHEEIEIGDRINTAVSGYGPTESRSKSIDPDACYLCNGHGCAECRGTGFSERRRR